MSNSSFQPLHINANYEDFVGNKGIGRYVFFPGSNSRAKEIAERHFHDVKVKEHSRGHNLYLGTMVEGKQKIDVASISSGMGTPSLDIIFNELVRLGAKRFLRMGTAGALQPQYMKLGDFIVATGAVRDEGASRNYVPPEYPAIASLDMVCAAKEAAKKLGWMDRLHVGLIHSKDSLYAREFESGPMTQQNKEYMDVLIRAGVIASEMEAALLFVLSSLFNHNFNESGVRSDSTSIKAGCICFNISNRDKFDTPAAVTQHTEQLILLCKNTIIELAKEEGVIV